MTEERKDRAQSTGGALGGGPMRWNPPGGVGVPVQKAKDARGAFWRLVGRFRPYSAHLAVVLLAAVASTWFSILSPKILAHIINVIVAGMIPTSGNPGDAGVDFGAVLHSLGLLAALYVFSSVFSYLQQYVMAGVAQKTVYALRRETMDKLARLPVRFYDERSHGEILSRFVNDFDNIGSTLQQSLTQLITAFVTFIGVIIMMLSISWLMTLVVVVTLPLSFVVTAVIARRSQGYFINRQAALGDINGHVEEMYTGHPIVKAFGRETEAIATFDAINERLYDYSWKAQFITGIIMPLMNFIGNIGYVLVSVIGGVMVTRSALKIGDILAFIQYARQFSQPIAQLSSIANVIQSTLASAERVFELLDEKEEPEEAGSALAGELEGDTRFVDKAEVAMEDALDGGVRNGESGGVPDGVEDGGAGAAAAPVELSARGAVRFDHVDFGYGEDSLLIEDMNIDVWPGQTVAIVGPTGAGKTTLVNLLMRFYDVRGGAITVNGRDVRDFRRSDLRSLFGMVLQDTWLFHGTIRDNIAYGRENASEEEIVQAAHAANADHFIRTLPDGYATLLNEESSNLSQGQRQLLTIARAILADPAILILDEATSSVDTRTEAHIQQAMRKLMQGRTSFVIAHRLSTIREADVILVMNRGRLVEQGTHRELLDADGFYAELYNSQFASEQRLAASGT